MPVETSAGAVVYRIEGKKMLFLLLHYEEGHWDFPKGHIEAGESELEAMKRETEEETGITQLEVDSKFREKISYFYTREKKKNYKEVFFYLAKTNEKKVKISFEHIGYEWLEYEKAVEKLTFNNAKEILKKAWKKLNSVG